MMQTKTQRTKEYFYELNGRVNLLDNKMDAVYEQVAKNSEDITEIKHTLHSHSESIDEMKHTLDSHSNILESHTEKLNSQDKKLDIIISSLQTK